jgi:hypothetical protein
MVLMRIPNPGYSRTPNLWLFRGLQTLAYFKDSKPLVWRIEGQVLILHKQEDMNAGKTHYASALKELNREGPAV